MLTREQVAALDDIFKRRKELYDLAVKNQGSDELGVSIAKVFGAELWKHNLSLDHLNKHPKFLDSSSMKAAYKERDNLLVTIHLYQAQANDAKQDYLKQIYGWYNQLKTKGSMSPDELQAKTKMEALGSDPARLPLDQIKQAFEEVRNLLSSPQQQQQSNQERKVPEVSPAVKAARDRADAIQARSSELNARVAREAGVGMPAPGSVQNKKQAPGQIEKARVIGDDTVKNDEARRRAGERELFDPDLLKTRGKQPKKTTEEIIDEVKVNNDKYRSGPRIK